MCLTQCWLLAVFSHNFLHSRALGVPAICLLGRLSLMFLDSLLIFLLFLLSTVSACFAAAKTIYGVVQAGARRFHGCAS